MQVHRQRAVQLAPPRMPGCALDTLRGRLVRDHIATQLRHRDAAFTLYNNGRHVYLKLGAKKFRRIDERDRFSSYQGPQFGDMLVESKGHGGDDRSGIAGVTVTTCIHGEVWLTLKPGFHYNVVLLESALAVYRSHRRAWWGAWN